MKKRTIRKAILGVLLAVFGTVFLSMYCNRIENRPEEEVIVAIVDSGLDMDSVPSERVYGSGCNLFHKVELMKDDYGHGTSVASLIVNNTNEKVKILPIRVTDEEGNASTDLVYEGIKYAEEHGADIINLSMNTYFYSEDTKLEELIDRLAAKGIPVVVSAGNSSDDVKYLSPANMESAIVVGAIDESGEAYYFSNYGDTVDYYAYGKYDGQLGTSYASAYVTSMLAEKMQVNGNNFEKALEKIPMKMWSENQVSVKGMDTGAEKEKDGTLYVGGVNKTKNNIGVGLLDLDWKNLDTEELDAYIGETDYRYVGLFLSKLTEEDKAALMEKSEILDTDVYVGNMEYSKEEDAYITASHEEIPYVEYALQCYEKEKEIMRVSEWVSQNDAVFYISSPDRTKIAKHSVSGFKGKYGVESTFNPECEAISTFTYVSSYVKGKDTELSYDGTFSMPKIELIRRYVRGARATLVDYYDQEGNFVKEYFSRSYYTAGTDNGDIYYSVSIKFKDYENTRAGYHISEDAVVAYDAGEGVGTSISVATRTDVASSVTDSQLKFANFNNVIKGSIVVKHSAVLKTGADINSFTTSDIASFGDEKPVSNIYYDSGQSSLTDGNSTFYLNANPFYAFGLVWYDEDGGALRSYSDVPEYVLKLAPNTYQVKYNANGGTGSMANSSHTYDKAKALTANAFTRAGYVFAGWNTKADGSGKSYANKASVLNLTTVNGGVVPLYAQWEPDVFRIDLDNQGADTAGTLYYYEKYNVGNFTMKSCEKEISKITIPKKTGYKFLGYFTQKEDGLQFVDADGTITSTKTTFTLDRTLYAHWEALDVSFTVNHYIEGLDESWILHVTDNKTGKANGAITLTNHKRTLKGFTYDHGVVDKATVTTTTIKPNGKLVVDLYYTRNSYKVTLTKGTGISGVTGAGIYKYNQTVNIDATVKKGYVWSGWTGTLNTSTKAYSFKMPDEVVAMTANAGDEIVVRIELDNQGAEGSGTLCYYQKFGVGNYTSEECTTNISKIENPSKTGYSFGGYFTEKNGLGEQYVLADGTITSSPTTFNQYTILYAHWMPISYTIRFDGNGATDGIMSDFPCVYGEAYQLPINTFGKITENGISQFLGWNIFTGTCEVLYCNGAKVTNLAESEGAVITLYAVWDDCPWINATDQYYSLKDAQNGLITYDELMSHATASDREDGENIPAGVNPDTGTSFTIIDYAPTDFTCFTSDGSVTETYQVIDSAGSVYKQRITVHIVDTEPKEIKPEGTTRFINEKYYYLPYEEGGLEDNSIWKTDPEYVAVMEDAFRRSRENDPEMSFYFTYETILKMKEFIHVNGIGNTVHEDALQRFYDEFMAPNMI